MKILVIDTDKLSRMIVEQCVTVLGHEIHHAETGKEGLAFAKENSPDLILMNDSMTDVDGLVATKSIRAYDKEDWLPIIFLTTKSDVEFYENGMLVGADGYLQKPINPSYLQLQITAMERICIMRRKLLGQKSLIKANKYLSKLVMVDHLTGLANRRHFEETIHREFNQAKRDKSSLSIVMCDIDHFKAYNDKYGHQAGDICLRNVGEAIEETLTRPADLVCRYGGEEFIVILPRTESAGALKMAEKIKRSVASKNIALMESKRGGRVTLSMGVASAQGQYKNIEDFIKYKNIEDFVKAADDALYLAKKNGRNRIEKAW
jgi:diguanylate cyclase (GGDEF)-like protein